jgi:Peptidase family M28
MLTNEQLDSESKNVYEMVKDICIRIGPGSPFTDQEKKRALTIKKYMEPVVDSIEIEEFQATKAYLGWFKPGTFLCLCSVLFFFLSTIDVANELFAILSFVLGLFVFLILILEFFLSIEFIDFLFKKHTSQNVIGKLHPKSTISNATDTKRIIIFSGHHDTSPEFNLLKYFKMGYYLGLAILFLTVFGTMVGALIRVIILFSNSSGSWNITSFMWFSIIFLPMSFLLAQFFLGTTKNGGTVPGAIDNLTSSSIAVALARILKENTEFHPDDTEIRVISFGAEEANMKGAWAYAKRHLNELKSMDALVINCESICSPEIEILTSDNNGFTKNSMELVQEVEKAAKNAGVPSKVEPFPFGGGGTDAYGFSRYKIKATSLFSLKVPEQMIEFYHQSTDNFDKVNLEAIKNVFKICLQFLSDFDPQK